MLRTVHPSEPKFYVYVHSRLHTGEPFYIGKGHGRRARKYDGRTQHWRRIVAKDGGFHKSFLVMDVDEEFAFLVEREAIDLFRRRGCALINFTDGGEGASGMKHTMETRSKSSAARKGKPLSPATMAAARAFHLGSKHSAEHIAKRVVALTGKRRTPEQLKAISIRRTGEKRSAEARANMSKAHIGKPSGRKGIPLSAEQVAKMSAAKIGKPSGRRGIRMTDEQKAKLSAANKGKTHSTETRAKMRISQLARWATIGLKRPTAA